ncbi:MAG: DUF3305 domain-containing protein [Pseudomonadota bacterium]
MLYIPLGVVVVRETIDHEWGEEQWRPLSVFTSPPNAEPWREMARFDDGRVTYHAGNVELDLHRKETAAYLANLDQPEPFVYVILREDDDPDTDTPVTLYAATASPLEAEAHGEGGDEIVAACAMPDELRRVVEAFCAEHYVDEKFVKRRRDRSERSEPHLFGQEPPDVVAARMRGLKGDRDGA